MNLLPMAVDIALALFALAGLLAATRLLRGPTMVDRVLALDTLYVLALAVVVLAGLRWGTALFFEAALVIALLGFVGTVSVCWYLIRGRVIG